MKKIKSLSLLLLFLLGLALLGGCGVKQAVSTPTDLSSSQAAEIIYHDLTYHGTKVAKVNVTSVTFSDKTTATVQFTYQSADGKNVTQKVILKKTEGRWGLEGHNH